MNSNLKNTGKKNKFFKTIQLLYDKITHLIIHIDFLFKNKFILQDSYIEKMHLLNDIQNKIVNLELINEKKKSKNIIENLIIDIQNSLQKICDKIGSNNCINTIQIYLEKEDFLEEMSVSFKSYFHLYNEYFIPLSASKITDVDKFLEKHNLTKSENPIVIKILEYTKNNLLIEKSLV